jgi:hypothetical protein
MRHRQAFGSLLVSIIFMALTAGPAHSWHGSGDITALAIDPGNPTTLYAATPHDGVFKTVDGGTTWNRTGLTDKYVGSLAIDRTTPPTVNAATWPAGVLQDDRRGHQLARREHWPCQSQRLECVRRWRGVCLRGPNRGGPMISRARVGQRGSSVV